MNTSATWIVRIRMPSHSMVRFQGILAGEDGLATLRSQAGGPDEHELWSTCAQREALEAWLASVPGVLEVEVLARYAYRSGRDK